MQADAADVIFSISDEYCSDSGTIELEISVTSTAAHDSAVLYDLMFDKNAFAFTGFKDYSEIEKECQFPNGFDDGKAVISLPFIKSEVRNCYICRMSFEIKEGVSDGVYPVYMQSLVKNRSNEVSSSVLSGSITVVSSDHKHDMHFAPAVKGNCRESGTLEHWYCSTCRKTFSDEVGTQEIASVDAGKDLAVHAGGTELRGYNAPTESEKGYTGDTYCLGCQTVISYGSDIPALGSDAASVVFTLSECAADPGGTAEIIVSVISSAEYNSAALFDLIYDKNVFTFEGFADYDAIEEKCMMPGGFDDEKAVIMLPLKNKEALNGYLCKIRFKVSGTAAEGSYIIGMSSRVKNGENDIASEVRITEIKVSDKAVPIVPGDVNCDGDTTPADAEILIRYFAGWPGYEEKILDKEAADMDGNGKLNRADCMLLARKVADWPQNTD